jgi:hypothetical protein
MAAIDQTEIDDELHLAAREGRVEDMERALDQGADINGRNPKQLMGTALMSAASLNR